MGGADDDGLGLLQDDDPGLAFDDEADSLLNTGKDHRATAEDNGEFNGVRVQDMDADMYDNMGDEEYEAQQEAL